MATERTYRVVFVGGVHGVGKTSFCRELAKDMASTHLSASALISGPEQIGREVESLEENQRLLVRALRSYECPSSLLLLDGHFVLTTSDGLHQPVPQWTFREMGASALILLTAPPSEIHARLLARDGSSVGPSEIDALQNREATVASVVAADLQLPLLRLANLDESRYHEAQSFLGQLPVNCRSE